MIRLLKMKNSLLILSASLMCMGAEAKSAVPVRDITVVIAADTHFDLLPETDQFYHVRTINRLPGTFVWPEGSPLSFVGDTLRQLDGVLIAGDIFDKARPEIRSLYKERYEQGVGDKRIHFPVYPGFGNHDINPVSGDSLQNEAGRLFNLQFMDSVLQAKLAAGEILNLHTSSRAYSWNVGDVHFVQMQTYAGDTSYSESNLDWLSDDLNRFASKGNPVVYIQHYGVDKWAQTWWPQEARNRLFDLLDQYNLAAFFVGHTHEPSVQTYRGYPIYQVNNAWPDEDGNGSFAVLRLKGDTVGITSCRWTDSLGHYEIVPPFLKSPLPRKISKEIHYNAFSHNDYWRQNPLKDALSFRFNCVEADLYLINGELYVSHDRPDTLDSKRTFKELYLKPLADRIRKNGGKVYPGSDRPFLLMVDCKTNGDAMYPVLKAQLEPYKDLFCSVEEGTFKERSVLFFLSGERPMTSLPPETTRITFLDGKIADLGKNIPYTLMPVVSDNFSAFFTWKGEGQMPADQLKRMREIMAQARKEGKLFRWWGAPDTENYKQFILKEGIDLIGADDLNSLFTILNESR